MCIFYVFLGYVVQGSNGEYVLLNPDERVELVKRVFQMTPSDKLIIAGSGCECRYLSSYNKFNLIMFH